MISVEAPLVSVILPVFNGRNTLSEAIRSILGQTYRAWELVIVDDGSTDGSAEIAEGFVDSRIRLLRNPLNRGQTTCLNQGIAEAKGGLLARQDADDVSHPDRLRRQVAAFEADPALLLVGTSGWMVDERGTVRGAIDLPWSGDEIAWSMLFGNPFLHTSVMMRVNAVVISGAYDLGYRICQDYDLWSRLLAGGGAARNLPDRLVRYRFHAGSLSHANRATVHAETRRVIEREVGRRFPDLNMPAAGFDLMARFGMGLESGELGAFDEIRTRVLRAWLDANPGVGRDPGLRRALVLQEIRCAFLALEQRSPRAILHALRAVAGSPSACLRKLRDRIWPDPMRA